LAIAGVNKNSCY